MLRLMKQYALTLRNRLESGTYAPSRFTFPADDETAAIAHAEAEYAAAIAAAVQAVLTEETSRTVRTWGDLNP